MSIAWQCITCGEVFELFEDAEHHELETDHLVEEATTEELCQEILSDSVRRFFRLEEEAQNALSGWSS